MALSPAKNRHTLDGCEVAPEAGGEPTLLRDRRHRRSLTETDLDERGAAFGKHAVEVRDNEADRIEPIDAAVKSDMGIMVADFNQQSWNFGCGDIRRIGHDNVEPRDYAIRPVTNHEFRPIREAMATGVRARGRDGIFRNVDAEPTSIGELRQQGQQYRAAAGAKIEQGNGAVAINHDEDRVDQSLGVRSWNQRLRRERQCEAVELLVADDPRYRLAGNPAAGQRLRSERGDRPGNFIVAEEHLVRSATKHVRNEEAGVESRRRTSRREERCNFVTEIGDRAGHRAQFPCAASNVA